MKATILKAAYLQNGATTESITTLIITAFDKEFMLQILECYSECCYGATTLSITAFSITTPSIRAFSIMVNKT